MGRTRRRTWDCALAALALAPLGGCAANATRGAVADVTTVATTAVPSGFDIGPPPADVPMYTVVQGDTIGKIATKLGVPAQAIVDANGLTNVDKLSIGQKLRIPAGGKAPDGSIVGGGPPRGPTPTTT